MKTYAIADLHGRFDLLCKAVSLIEADAGDEGGHMICLGDFVDRGPQSRSIVDLLMAGPSLPNWRWTVLQGNHEAMMLEVLAAPTQPRLQWWLGNGGGATLISYGYKGGENLHPLRVPAEHLDWLMDLPATYEDGHRIFVHAGVPFDRHVGDVSRDTLQWMLYPGDVDHGRAEFYDDVPHISGKHIVHGHHQSDRHPLLLPHRTNLDSFAWATGRLAIGVFDDSQAAPVKIIDAISKSLVRGPSL
jgi:serine/threonine protein phosphatase 1